VVSTVIAELHAQLILLGDLNERSLVELLLDALEGEPVLRPTHCGG